MIEGCASVAEHRSEMKTLIANPARYSQFVAYADSDQAVGFVEASVRIDHVNGATTSPVAFLEGVYVVPEARRRGVAASLVAAVTQWALGVGCREFALDALLENDTSQQVHRALGFRETERVGFFCKALYPSVG